MDTVCAFPLPSNPGLAKAVGRRTADGVLLADLGVGQHLELSQSGAGWPDGSLGQARAQSSLLRACRAVKAALALSASGEGSPLNWTNSGWMVVEWMPSWWKNSLMFSATWKAKAKLKRIE